MSTDVVGLRGHIDDVLPFWSRIAPELTDSLGIEVISTHRALSQIDHLFLPYVAGFHGRTNRPHYQTGYKSWIANSLIADFPHILKVAGKLQNHPYLLLHQNSWQIAKDSGHLPEILDHRIVPVCESDPTPGSLKHALDLLPDLGDRANLVLDVLHIAKDYHFTHFHSQTNNLELLKIYSRVAPKARLCHLSIGTDRGDSFPLSTDIDFLRGLSHVLSQHDIQLVLECQWGGLGSIRCNPVKQAKHVEHVSKWLDRLRISGLVKI